VLHQRYHAAQVERRGRFRIAPGMTVEGLDESQARAEGRWYKKPPGSCEPGGYRRQ
jgi:hypothetical protein